ISAFLRDRLDVPRRLRARRNKDAARGGTGRRVHRSADSHLHAGAVADQPFAEMAFDGGQLLSIRSLRAWAAFSMVGRSHQPRPHPAAGPRRVAQFRCVFARALWLDAPRSSGMTRYALLAA